MQINSGALWGLIAIVLISIIVSRVRKKRSERGWKKYGEEQVYRPEEWENRQGMGRGESETKGIIGKSNPAEPRVSPGTPEETGSGRDVQRSDIQNKSSSGNIPSLSGDKGISKANKRSGITIPSIEPIY
ncbi:MAG TPA: hypothetical protein VMV95_00165 [Bacillota bacterium]|nr:hypothetical protein [Bacillota bacterium]